MTARYAASRSSRNGPASSSSYGDIDLVVRERDASRWKERLGGLGYTVFHESGAFLQLQPPSPAASVWNADPQREEKRLAIKCHERFVLTE